jgi:hypothetical protein
LCVCVCVCVWALPFRAEGLADGEGGEGR